MTKIDPRDWGTPPPVLMAHVLLVQNPAPNYNTKTSLGYAKLICAPRPGDLIPVNGIYYRIQDVACLPIDPSKGYRAGIELFVLEPSRG